MNENSENQSKNQESMLHKQKKVLNLQTRLMIGFTLIISIFVVASFIGYFEIISIKRFSGNVKESVIPSYDRFTNLNADILLTQINTQSILLTKNPIYLENLKNIWNKIDTDISTIDELSNKWINKDYIKYWSNLKSLIAQLKILQLKMSEDIPGDTAQKLRTLEAEISPLIEKIMHNLNESNTLSAQSTSLLDLQLLELKTDFDEIINDLNITQYIQIIIIIVGIIISYIIARMTMRSISRYIKMFRQHSKRIASGDLTQLITVKSHDEMGQLGNDLNTMTKSLAGFASDITKSCHDMVSTLEEVRQAVSTQSAGANEQSSSINEITSSLSEIEKSSAQTMDKAQSLGESAERMREKWELGLDAVDQSMSGMNEIKEKVQIIAQTILDLGNQTQQVGEITGAVNNLAQQSKMLALNASIEAAKAGEAGKGFAVVALEVKNLAEQSEAATRQVQKILEDIRHAAEKAVMVTEEGTKGVDHGTDLVQQTGEIIKNLSEVIHETTVASQQIKSAVCQEGAGIEQITTGMNEINSVTSSFVDSVRQTKEAMSNLATIAKNLKSYVDMFKT